MSKKSSIINSCFVKHARGIFTPVVGTLTNIALLHTSNGVKTFAPKIFLRRNYFKRKASFKPYMLVAVFFLT
jgi:hypothetical protein